MDKIAENSIVSIFSADEFPRNGDQFFPFRQNSDFYYLTGINYPDTLLLMLKKGTDTKSILFLYKPTDKELVYDGNFLTPEVAKSISGVDDAFYASEDLKNFLEEDIFPEYSNLYAYFPEEVNYKPFVNLTDRLKLQKYEKAEDVICRARQVKSAVEIEMIKKALKITHEALSDVKKFIKPGVSEREIYARLLYNYYSRENTGASFEPIVATGANAIVLHYTKLNSFLKKNDLLLIDTGAEYYNYAADITRVFPVGKMTQVQAKVIEAVYDVQQTVMKHFKPGETINTLNKYAFDLIKEKLLQMGLVKEKSRNIDDEVKKYYPHGLTHFMGLDVHDCGSKDDILKPGMVLTCEPGLYIKEWNIGVRIEDDVLITETGYENLSKDIPLVV